MSWKSKNYTVGYGRPPRSTRFKKGQSGNPKGRGKGRINLATEFDKELQKQITVIENGKSKKIPKGRAIVKQTISKALSGDPKQIAAVLAQARHQEAAAYRAAPPSSLGSAEDLLVMENIRKRFLASLASTSTAAAIARETPKPSETPIEGEESQ